MARTTVRLFLLVATAEAISWAGLLIGMYVKYVADGGERGVQIFGPIHGGIFVAYVVLTLLVARLQRWSVRVDPGRSGLLHPAVCHPGFRVVGRPDGSLDLPHPGRGTRLGARRRLSSAVPATGERTTV